MLRALSYSPAYNDAIGTVEPYRGTDHTVQKMIELAKGDRGERSIKVRRHTEQIIQNVRPKDYSSEIIAIARWWGNAGRYTRDPVHVEMIRDPERLVDDALAGKSLLDCDDVALAIVTGCLVIGSPARLITVGFRRRIPGQEKNHTHVFASAQDPRTRTWWVLDPVAGRKTGNMLKRVQDFSIFEVD